MGSTTTITPDSILKEISAYQFFLSFPKENLDTLSQILQVRNFKAEEKILVQGQANQCLYFLRSGQLDILVDGERVGFFNSQGEVLGEMSVIGKSPAKSSILALSDVSVFELNFQDISKLPVEEQKSFQILFNQVLTQILVLRLERTNDRAKLFEANNKELQRTQDRLLDLNRDLEEEIRRRSLELVEKVKNISEEQLSQTTKEMSQALQHDMSSVDSSRFREWTMKISEAVELLKPVIDLSERRGQNRFRRILICTDNPKQRSIAKLALSGTGVNVEVFSNGEELLSSIQTVEADLLVIDAKMFSSIEKIKTVYPALTLLIVIEEDLNSYLEMLNRFPEQPYFIYRDSKNRSLNIKGLTSSVAKILNQELFGPDKYLSYGTKIIESKITNSDRRFDFIEEMKSHFTSAGVRSSIIDNLHLVADELLMNAIYDAPTDSAGRPRFNHLSRTHIVDLPEHEAVTLRYGTDGVYLAISVTDPFGSLKKSVLKSYLEKNIRGEETAVANKGGAGKGLYLIVVNSDFVVFNVKPGKKTELICFFQLEKNNSEDPQPHFHLFFS